VRVANISNVNKGIFIKGTLKVSARTAWWFYSYNLVQAGELFKVMKSAKLKIGCIEEKLLGDRFYSDENLAALQHL
jgi:hypothetical protein